MYKCYYGSMYKRKNIVTRISLEARKKLAKLSKEKGITNIDIIDYILGTSSKKSLQRLRNALDQDNKNWDNWIKQVKSTSSSWNRRGFRYDEKNAKPSLEAAKKILKDMRSFERSNEPLDKYNEYFDRYRERHIELIKEQGSTAKDRTSNRPPKAILDAAILSAWSPEEMALIERDLGNPDPDDFWGRSRSDIQVVVRNKMGKSWANLYRKWFKNNTNSMSPFEVTIDNRLFALVRAGFIQKGKQKGTYQLSRELSKDEWDIVTGINKLPAQKGLVIPTLLDHK